MKRYLSSCMSVLLATLAMTVRAQSKIQYWIDYDSDNIIERHISGNTFSTVIDTRGLSDGLHLLSYRATNGSGIWSAQRTSFFYISPAEPKSAKAIGLQYWVDNDDQKKRNVSLTDGSVSESIDISGMSPGLHRLTYRAVDDRGTWSAQRTSLVLIPGDTPASRYVTEAQHWIDDGIDSRISEPITHSGPQAIYVRDINVSARTSGANLRVRHNSDSVLALYDLHYLHARFRDDRGKWTALLTDSFAVAYGNVKVDVTGLLINPDANNHLVGWNATRYVNTTAGQHYSDSSRPYFSLGDRSTSNWTASMAQTLPSLPAGNYMLSVVARGHSEVVATLSANDQKASIATIGSEGGEIWQQSRDGSAEKNVNGGKGFGWSEATLMVTSDGSPMTIKVEGVTSQPDGFLDVVDFHLVKVASTTLTVNFAPSIDLTLYKGIRLRLQGNSTSSTVTVSGKRAYEFAGLSDTAPYTVALLNEYDQILWQHEGFTIANDGNDITISDIRPTRTLSLKVTDASGADVSRQVKAEWVDASANVLASGLNVEGMADGNEVGYRLTLGDSLGVVYSEPPLQLFEIGESTANLTCRLAELPKTTLSGSVTSGGHSPWKARVNVVQRLNGKYRHTADCTVGDDGRFSLDLPDDSLSLLISASGAYNHTLDLPRPADVGNIDLRRINSKAIRLDIEATGLRSESEPAETTSWLGGYDNLQFKARNLSQADAEVPIVIQNGMLYIEEATHGDRLELSVADRSGYYIGATCQLTFDADSSMVAEFLLKAHGSLNVGVSGSDNPSTEYILFDSDGNFVRSALANGERGATIDGLASGDYTVVAIGGSSLLGMFSDINSLQSAGFKEGQDYVKAPATIADALITEVKLPFLPRLDETRFYYTTDLTSFVVNETQPIPGSYVTFTTRLDFKDEHKASVDELQLNVDIPDGMDYIHNSAIVGSEPVLASIEGNRLIIPLTRENHLERIRFCFVPTQPGTSYTTAYVHIVGDKVIDQPIGRIAVNTRDLEINAPNTTLRPGVTVNGTAVAGSTVVVYDDNIAIGTAEVKKDGRWQTRCTLDEAYNLSTHPVYARITTPDGVCLTTPTRNITCNIHGNRVKTVTMINTAHRATLEPSEFRTVFDFDNPSENSSSYNYWPKYPDFTFVADFADNNPENVGNVQIHVKTTAGTDRVLKATYDSISDKWVATGQFVNSIIPVNVSVAYESTKSDNLIDSNHLTNYIKIQIK